ncbi:MAG TPA: transposase family protein [Candidatus Acidoferrales bacterium]|nr:transposase family protein [Candidatus Acidoferrales bacterium]
MGGAVAVRGSHWIKLRAAARTVGTDLPAGRRRHPARRPPGRDRPGPVGVDGRHADAQEHHPGGRRGRLQGQPSPRSAAAGTCCGRRSGPWCRLRAAPREIAGKGTLLADGTVCPVWDWSAIPGLFSAKAGYPGMNVQVAATMSGQVAAVGPVPVPGARHDAHAFAASGLAALIAGMDAVADLGCTGVDGIAIVPFRTPPGGQLHQSQSASSKQLSAIRAAVERAVGHVKTWRMLSEEGGRFRPPIAKYEDTLR